jgi:hypothetical protein
VSLVVSFTYKVLFNCRMVAFQQVLICRSFFSFIIVLGGVTLWHLHLQRFLQCIKCIILEFTPSTALFHPPHSSNSFNRYCFCIYIHVYTLFALYSSSHTLSPPPPPHHRTRSTLLFSDFVEEKR